MRQSALNNLVALGEGFTTEFKRSGTSNLGRELCAFANTDGGIVLIGVSDDGKIIGAENHNRLNSEVQAVARSAEPRIEVAEHWFTVIFPRKVVESVVQQDPATHQVTPHVRRLLEIFQGEMSREELMKALQLNDRVHFMKRYLKTALNGGFVEMTLPDKPRSRSQKYRLTHRGKAVLNRQEEGTP